MNLDDLRLTDEELDAVMDGADAGGGFCTDIANAAAAKALRGVIAALRARAAAYTAEAKQVSADHVRLRMYLATKAQECHEQADDLERALDAAPATQGVQG